VKYLLVIVAALKGRLLSIRDHDMVPAECLAANVKTL
jgi:hypothetical protein